MKVGEVDDAKSCRPRGCCLKKTVKEAEAGAYGSDRWVVKL